MTKKKKIILLVIATIFIGFIVAYFHTKDEKVYTLKHYDHQTKETSFFNYKIENTDTIIHGKFVKYNEKGVKISDGNFANNHIYGKFISYFENGNIKAEHFKINKELNSESIWNYSNGKIERYILNDEFGNAVFIIRYDEQSNVKNYEGLALIETFQYKIKFKDKFELNIDQYLKVGDTLRHEYLLANIPKSERAFKIELIDSENKKINRKITDILPAVLKVEEVLTKKGVNTFRATVEYKFDDKYKTVINDTISFDVEVH